MDNTILNSLIISLVLILTDALMGIFLSIKGKTFDIRVMPQFLKTNLLPYIGGLLIIGIGANYISELMPVFLTCVSLVSIKFGIEIIKDKVIKLFE